VPTGFPAGAVFVDVVPSFSGFPNALRNGLVPPAENAGGEAGGAAGDGLSEGLLGSVKKLAAPLALAVGALGIGAMFVSSISDAIEQGRITDKLAASLGATGSQAENIGRAAGNLYAGAYGESVEDVADQLQGILTSGLIDKNASQADIEAVSAQVMNLSSTFGEESGAIAKAAEQMLRTGLVDNATEAFDVLTTGFQNGTNKAEDLLDTFNEYGVQFEKLGLDGETSLGILSQGLQNGARDADLVADALKEFSIRAIDGSASTVAGYEAIGLSADEMTAKIAAGGEGAREGLAQVLDGLRGIEDPAARAAAATALFGTQSEDLGAALYALDPTTAVAGLGEVAGAAERLGTTLNDNAATNLESFKRQASQAFVNVVGGEILPIVERFATVLATRVGPVLGEVGGGVRAFVAAFRAGDGDVTSSGIPGTFERIGNAARTAWDAAVGVAGAVSGFVRDNATGLSIVAGAIGGAATAFGLLYVATQAYAALRFGVFLVQYAAQVGVVNLATRAWAVVQAGLNLVMSANPISLVVLAIGALVGAVILAWNTSSTFREIVLGAWGAVRNGVGGVVEWFTGTALPFVTGVFTAIGDAATWLYVNAIVPAWEGIRAAVDVVVGLVVGYVNLWIEVLSAVGDAVSFLYRNIVDPVFTLIRDAIRFAWEWVRDNVFAPLVEWLGQKLALAFTVYRDLVLTVWTAVRNGISTAWNWVRDNVFTPIVTFLSATLGPAFTTIRDTAVNAWGLLRDGVESAYVYVRDKVLHPLRDLLTGATGSVVAWFTKAKDDAGTAWAKIKEAVQGPLDWLTEFVWTPLKTMVETTIPGYFTTAVGAISTAWGAIKKAAGTPVKFVVETIINNGIVDTFNNVASAIGSSARLKRIELGKDWASFSTGGAVFGPGTGTSDDVPAWLSNGEYVVKASRVRELGVGFMDALNAGRFATGGLVGKLAGAVTDPVGTMRSAVNGLLDKVPGGGEFRNLVLGLPTKVLDVVVSKLKSLVDAIVPGGDGGELGTGTGGSGWQWQMKVLRAVFPGLPLNSGYRPGSITASGNLSYHARGRAVDVPPRADVFNWIRANYGATTKELIYSPMGALQLKNGKSHVYTGAVKAMHYNHVHWAYRNGGLVDQPLSYDSGGYLPPGVTSVFNGTGKPEPVFTSAQAASLLDSPSSAEVVAALHRLADLAAVGNAGNVDGLDRVLAAVEAQPRRSLALARQGVK
jgi:phage-related protein